MQIKPAFWNLCEANFSEAVNKLFSTNGDAYIFLFTFIICNVYVLMECLYLSTTKVTTSLSCNFYVWALHQSEASPKCKHQVRLMHRVRCLRSIARGRTRFPILVKGRMAMTVVCTKKCYTCQVNFMDSVLLSQWQVHILDDWPRMGIYTQCAYRIIKSRKINCVKESLKYNALFY